MTNDHTSRHRYLWPIIVGCLVILVVALDTRGQDGSQIQYKYNDSDLDLILSTRQQSQQTIKIDYVWFFFSKERQVETNDLRQIDFERTLFYLSFRLAFAMKQVYGRDYTIRRPDWRHLTRAHAFREVWWSYTDIYKPSYGESENSTNYRPGIVVLNALIYSYYTNYGYDSPIKISSDSHKTFSELRLSPI